MHIGFRNRHTNEIREVKIGFSWTLFIFCMIFGLPLFLRGLAAWGGLCAGLWGVYITLIFSGAADDQIGFIELCILLPLRIWLGWNGNKMTAHHLLENGWEMAETDPTKLERATKAWDLRPAIAS
jgi:hypothetical protein